MTKARDTANLMADGAIGADELASTLDLSGKTLTLPAGTALPSQSGQNGNFLTTDGTSASWSAVDALPSQSGQSGKYLTTDGSTASWDVIDTSAAGNDTELQYNNSGARAGASGLVTDGSNLTIKTQGDIRFGDADDSNYVGFQAPATVAADKIWTLPDADGTNGQVLATNGSGTLSWQSGATPGAFADGTAGSPSITFSADTNTGFYRSATDRVTATASGQNVAHFHYNGSKPQVSFWTTPNSTEKPAFYPYSTLMTDTSTAGVGYQWNNNVATGIGTYFNGDSAYSPSTDAYQCNVFVRTTTNGRTSAPSEPFWPAVNSYWYPRASGVVSQIDGGSGYPNGAAFSANIQSVYVSSVGYYARIKTGITSGVGVGHYIDMSGHPFGNANVGVMVRQMDDGSNTNGCVGFRYLDESGSNTKTAMQFLRTSSRTQVGSITVTTSATAYNTSSDYRLKENIVELTGGIDAVLQMRPVTFDWKSGGNSVGFIAHELQTIVPEAVSGEKDAYEPKGIVDENGDPVLGGDGNPQTEPDLDKPIYQGVDSSFLVPHLVKAVQELKGIIDTQASTITALEARITSLEAA